ncbi:hypothetical protein BKA83DRAFT_4498028 [Pisolithus microcarpus]|nr:hypothetical protein BKA83DRAFT_4498028 [Pisolithus microcarpus]
MTDKSKIHQPEYLEDADFYSLSWTRRLNLSVILRLSSFSECSTPKCFEDSFSECSTLECLDVGDFHQLSWILPVFVQHIKSALRSVHCHPSSGSYHRFLPFSCRSIMQASSQDLVTQFTEDAHAGADRVCDRSKCQTLIRKGDPCHYVASYNPAQPGKYVCDDCYKWYKSKPATTVRARGAQSLPNPQVIRQSISAAQSRASINPPPVMAMSNLNAVANASMLMPPPPLLLARNVPQLAGPGVHVPSAFGPLRGSAPSMPMPQALPFGSTGYTPQHLQYRDQHRQWAQRALRPPPAECISLVISAVHETSRKRVNVRTNVINNICEGLKEIDAQSTALELAAIALETVVPRIKAYCPEFSWEEKEFVVRDSKWVDLMMHAGSHPYFYNDCIHPSKKGAKVVFKSKQFALYVIVPESQWERVEEFRNILKAKASSNSTTHSVAAPLSASPTPRSSTHLFYSETSPPGVPASATSGDFERLISEDVARLRKGSNELSTSVAVKRHFRYPSTSSTDSTRAPPQKKPATVARVFSLPHNDPSPAPALSNDEPAPTPSQKKPATTSQGFLSLDHEQLKAALQTGGASDFDDKQVFRQKIIPIDFYPIPTCDLYELISTKVAFDINSADLFSGNVRLNVSNTAVIGVGAFKTAQKAQLNLSPLRKSGLGSQLNHDVILKRPYIDDHPTEPGPPFTRYSLKDESSMLYREANVLYWAKALLKMTYDFVDCAIQGAEASPPFNIPRLRFVDAGLLLTYSSAAVAPPEGSKRPAKPSGMVCTMFLAEEFIPTMLDADFVKYIHNGDAVPCDLINARAEEIALFLAFTQHVQYTRTGGQVYISDYQGSELLLTDPQILTHPEVGAGLKLFSEGNLQKGVECFEKQHICNKFCRWEGFRLSTFPESKTPQTEEEEEIL